MKKIIYILFLTFIMSCSKNPESYIEHLDGYWEIDEVTLRDGSKRDYNYNDTVDFISMTDSLTGIRKKMKPNFNGTYETSNDVEDFTLKIENDSLNVYYKTPFANWKETILEATDDKMIVRNHDNLIYIYKRFVPIDVNK